MKQNLKYSDDQINEIVATFIQFASSVFSKDLRPYQAAVARPIIRSVLNREGEVFTLLQCRQSGKTEMLIILSIFLAVSFPGIRIGIYAPTFKQAMDIIMRRVKSYLRMDIFQGNFDINRGNMVVFKRDPNIQSPFSDNIEGSMIGAHSADVSARIEGATWDLLFLDEAQDIERSVIDVSLEPMLTATAGTMVLTGTPFTIDCAFYDTIQAIRNGKIRGKHFAIDYKTVIKYFPLYAKTVEKAMARNGEDSLSFQTQYNVQWVGGIGLFFNFDEFVMRGDETLGWLTEPLSEFQYVAGLDIGGASKETSYVPDETVLTISRIDIDGGLTLVNIYRWRGVNWKIMESEVTDLLRKWRPIALAIDTTGIGQSTGFSINDTHIVPYTFLVNLTPITKSAIGYNVESTWKLGKFRYPAKIKNDNYFELLNQARWLVRSIKQDQLKKMNWYVDERHGNDDIVSSLFLCLWAHRLLKNEGVGVGNFMLPKTISVTKDQLLSQYFGVQ